MGLWDDAGNRSCVKATIERNSSCCFQQWRSDDRRIRYERWSQHRCIQSREVRRENDSEPLGERERMQREHNESWFPTRKWKLHCCNMRQISVILHLCKRVDQVDERHRLGQNTCGYYSLPSVRRLDTIHWKPKCTNYLMVCQLHNFTDKGSRDASKRSLGNELKPAYLGRTGWSCKSMAGQRN